MAVAKQMILKKIFSGFNSLAAGRCSSNLQTHFAGCYHKYILGNCSHVNVTEPIDDDSKLFHVFTRCRQTQAITWAKY